MFWVHSAQNQHAAVVSKLQEHFLSQTYIIKTVYLRLWWLCGDDVTQPPQADRITLVRAAPFLQFDTILTVKRAQDAEKTDKSVAGPHGRRRACTPICGRAALSRNFSGRTFRDVSAIAEPLRALPGAAAELATPRCCSAAAAASCVTPAHRRTRSPRSMSSLAASSCGSEPMSPITTSRENRPRLNAPRGRCLSAEAGEPSSSSSTGSISMATVPGADAENDSIVMTTGGVREQSERRAEWKRVRDSGLGWAAPKVKV